MSPNIKSKDELIGLSDDELIDVLAEFWGVKDKKLVVWGEMDFVKGQEFAFLQNARLIETDRKLNYPLEGIELETARFYVGAQDTSRCSSEQRAHLVLVMAELELSPRYEREKHENPLLLCVKRGTVEPLKELPQQFPLEIINSESSQEEKKQYIYSNVYDFFYNKSKKQLESEFLKQESIDNDKLEAIKKDVEREQEKNKAAIEAGAKLYEKQTDRKEKIKNLNEKIKKLKEEKKKSEDKVDELNEYYLKIEEDMNKKMGRLKEYMEEKAQFLKTFEFIDEDDIDSFLSKSKPISNRVEGVSFYDDFQGDYSKAVSYVQSYLVNNNILYPRHIIENFLTLLRTKDLIVLAGDSGSGKTNLVKSFASAVGGKSVIIPVKPNWTSSEDLLGYYNPLEKKYLATPFLEALLEAQRNPEIPYFICLDEMNLARVEYYFADFLSLLESRGETPEIILYSEDESSHVLSELKAIVDIIQSSKEKYSKDGVVNFIELLKDEELNDNIRNAFGFGDQDSLIKYHNEIRRMLSAVMELPSSIKMPSNVHIIGAINIDETTHYLSPKILDRAHIMRFESPLLTNWDAILDEVEQYDLGDTSQPLLFEIEALGYRKEYPGFDREDPFCQLFIELNKEFFNKLGVEFGMRTIRQGLSYLEYFQDVNDSVDKAINNFLLHKVLPKFTFDGNKYVGEHTKLELIDRIFTERVKQQLPNYESYDPVFSAVHALEKLVKDAKANDGIINFWSK